MPLRDLELQLEGWLALGGEPVHPIDVYMSCWTETLLDRGCCDDANSYVALLGNRSGQHP